MKKWFDGEFFKKNRFLTIFVCIFLSVVLIFGTVMGIVIAVNNAKTVVRYGNVNISEGEARYLASIYKKEYMRSLSAMGIARVSDTEAFWSTDSGDGQTYGDHLERGYREYLAGIAVKSSLYLDNANYGSSEKKAVEDKVLKRLSYLDCKTPDGLNEISDSLGFGYKDMLGGTGLLYQAAMAYTQIYGAGGENLANYPGECNDYLEEYSHVFLIYLRNEDVYVLDENGNVTYDGDGNILMREQSEEEREARLALAEEIRQCIDNYYNDRNDAMSPEAFANYMKNGSDTDPNMFNIGYYFRDGAEVTGQFAEVYPEVVSASLEMKIGEYREVQCSDSVCFIYRAPVVEGAYKNSDNPFFSDFYSDGAAQMFSDAIELLSENVDFDEKLSRIDIFSIPANKEYYVNF